MTASRRVKAPPAGPYLRSVTLLRERVERFDVYPFNIPALAGLETLELHPRVTFLVGDNGTGKSTLIEAIAVAAGFNAEGGSRNFNFSTRSSESDLHRCLRLTRNVARPRDGFFLRAESYFNVASEIERLDEDPAGGPPIIEAYGRLSLHEQSHGESFLVLAQKRFHGQGLYLLDEPEAALSPARQLMFLAVLHDLARHRGSQFIIATHSPILMGYPDAKIIQFGKLGLQEVAYEDTDHFRITRNFLTRRDAMLRELLDGDPLTS